MRLSILFVILPLFAAAAGFDCNLARTKVEKMICADETVSHMDETLSAQYRTLRTQSDETARRLLIKDQRAWLKTRNRCGDTACLQQTYETRIAKFRHKLDLDRYRGQQIKVTNVIEQSYDNAPAIAVRFSVPVDATKPWREYLRIVQKEPLDPDKWILDDDGLVAVYPFVEPASRYKVSIKEDLAAVNGSGLHESSQHSVSTRAIKPFVQFADKGTVLSSKLPMALPVQSLDVDEVDLDVFRIQEETAWFRHIRRRNFSKYQIDGFKDKQLIYSGRFTLKQKPHQRLTTNLDLSGVDPLKRPGVYVAVLHIPGTYVHDQFAVTYFTVSDIGVEVRKHDDAIYVTTRSIAEGNVRSDVSIELYRDLEKLAETHVDPSGEALIKGYYGDRLLIMARSADELTVLRFDRNALDLSGFDNARTRHRPQQVFAWGARDLYRPGETVQLFALLRDFDGRSIDPFPLEAKVYDATGNHIRTLTLNAASGGAYSLTLHLDKNAKTGSWHVRYGIPGSSDVLYDLPFQVEEFLPERMRLTLFDGDPTKRRYVFKDDKITIPVQGDYLYGAPAGGNKLDGQVIAEIDRHPFDRWKGFFFGLDDEQVPHRRRNLPEIRLESNGSGKMHVSLYDWQNVVSPLAVTTSLSLYESGGRPVTRSVSVTRISRPVLVGIEPQVDGEIENHSRPEFKLMLTDPRGEPVRAENYRLALIREDRNYYWHYDYSGWRWHYDPLDYEVYSTSVSFDGKSPTLVSMPVKWGKYRIEVRDGTDTLVNRFRFNTRWRYWRDTSDASKLRPDMVRMQMDKSQYQAGDAAQVLLMPPTDGRAVVSVLSNDDVLWRRQLDVKARGTTVTIPIDAAWHRHDLYVTTTVLKPGDMQHAVAPKRAFGMMHLPLRRADAPLDLTLKVPERIQPGRTVTAHIEARDAASKEVWVALAAVDVGVLNITRFKTPDPLGYFFGARRYDFTHYDVYGRIIENAGFPLRRHRFGGGHAMSEAELSRGGERPDSKVRIVAIQKLPVRLDEHGSGEINVTIPDFNGQLRFMAVAWSARSYGNAEAKMTVADKVVAQVLKPRFLAAGDHSRVGLDLTNLTDTEQTLNLSVTSGGTLVERAWTEILALRPKEKRTLSFPLDVRRAGEGVVTMRLRNDAADPISIDKQWSIGCREAYPAVTRKEFKVLDRATSWGPGLKTSDLKPESIQALLHLSSLPPINLKEHFRKLLHYPYGCTEQSTSSGYPWVLVTPDAAKTMGLTEQIETQFKKPYSDAFRREQIERAVNRILPRQRHSGGFSLWSGNGRELSWLSVYATDFLVDARLAGADVPNDALYRALNRLEGYLRQDFAVTGYWTSNGNYYRFAVRAYAAYVLAKSGRGRLSDVRRIYEKYQQMHVSTLPWAHLTYAFVKNGDASRAAQCLSKVKNTPYARSYYGDYGSQLRDLALSIAVLHDAEKPVMRLFIELFDVLKKRSYLSTQERNALFKAALAGDASQSDRVRATIIGLGHTVHVDQRTPYKSLMDAQQFNDLVRLYNQSPASAYLTLTLVGSTIKPPEPVAHSMHITRSYYDLDGQQIDPDTLRSGDLIIVRLATSADFRAPDALVVDLLPAGLELENQNLANASVDISRLMIENQTIAQWEQNSNILHVEYRDDRYIAALDLRQHHHVNLFYLARAVTPGTYSVPAPYVEDMYRPYNHAIGATPEQIRIVP